MNRSIQANLIDGSDEIWHVWRVGKVGLTDGEIGSTLEVRGGVAGEEVMASNRGAMEVVGIGWDARHLVGEVGL